MTAFSTTPLAQPAPVAGTQFGNGIVVTTGRALVHLLLNLPVGVLHFTVLAVGLSLGVGLLITLVGIPILIGMGWVVRTLASIERARLNGFLGTTLRDPYREPQPETGWVVRLAAIGKDPATWRDFLYLALRLPIGIFTFTAMVTTWAITLGLLLSPVSYWLGYFQIQIAGIVFDGPKTMVLATMAGLLMIVVSFGITRGLAKLETMLGAALLDASPEELKRRVDDVTRSRAKTMSAADQERRRLERDLHDGAQQRLVSLAMTLGLAQQKLASDPEQGARLVNEAHEEAKRALQDLRDLARGIHPAILTDHGLDAALPALAARCPIPARVDVAVSPRPSAAAESAAYFVVSEALTNVARYSRATQVRVTARREQDMLTVDVWDDGIGNATMTPGGGLAGLADRVEALDGRLTVSSPERGPTLVHAEIPCGS